jgi:hypothetical protein
MTEPSIARTPTFFGRLRQAFGATWIFFGDDSTFSGTTSIFSGTTSMFSGASSTFFHTLRLLLRRPGRGVGSGARGTAHQIGGAYAPPIAIDELDASLQTPTTPPGHQARGRGANRSSRGPSNRGARRAGLCTDGSSKMQQRRLRSRWFVSAARASARPALPNPNKLLRRAPC